MRESTRVPSISNKIISIGMNRCKGIKRDYWEGGDDRVIGAKHPKGGYAKDPDPLLA